MRDVYVCSTWLVSNDRDYFISMHSLLCISAKLGHYLVIINLVVGHGFKVMVGEGGDISTTLLRLTTIDYFVPICVVSLSPII